MHMHTDSLKKVMRIISERPRIHNCQNGSLFKFFARILSAQCIRACKVRNPGCSRNGTTRISRRYPGHPAKAPRRLCIRSLRAARARSTVRKCCSFFMFCLSCIPFVESRIDAVLRHELFMRSALFYSVLGKNKNALCVPDR